MIKCGSDYCSKWLIIFLILSAASCKAGTNKNHGDNSQSENLQSKLPKDFSAVGLVYHRFGDNRYPSTNTPLDKFEEQLKYLTENDFETYTASDLYRNPNGKQKNIFITVDDGLNSFYTHGWPLLQKYNCKATLFVNTESVGWGDYLSWNQLRELVKEGVEIGSHSHKHTYFLNVPHDQRVQTFEQDLDVSEQLFKDSLGLVPKTYAYPYGEFDEQMAEVLKARGYLLGFAQNSGVWGSITDPFAIPRFPTAGNFVELKAFKEKVNMKPFLVHGLSDFPLEMKDGESLTKVLSIDSINDINSINCYFNNSQNNYVAKLQRDSIQINLSMPSNSRRVLLTLTTMDTSGQWLWWSKLLVNIQEK